MAVIGLLLINIGILAWLWLSPRGREPKVFFLEKELNFTPEQSLVYRKLRKAHFKQVEMVRDSVGKMKQALIKKITKNLSDAELWKESTAIESKHVQINVMNYKHLQEVYQLCDAEQKKKFDAMIDEIAFQINKPPFSPPPRRGQGLHPPPPEGEGMSHEGRFPPR